MIFKQRVPVRPAPAGRRRAVNNSESGQILILMGFMALVLFGIMGLSIDLGRVFVARAQLGRAVDAAALSGVLEFDGTTTGTAEAKTVATQYLSTNEPTATPNLTTSGDNTLTVDATKSVKMFFISVLGINSVTVKGHAAAGFSNGTLDAVMILDATSSMGDAPCNGTQNNTGCPIWEAKNAAKAFKDVLLGTSPSGNVVVGATAFRGCYRVSSGSGTTAYPWASTQSNCVSSSQTTALGYNKTTLDTGIGNISAVGGSGTNLCTGLAKGYETLIGTGNHNNPVTYPNNRQFLVLLSDGDNRYTGSYTYQASPVSPNGTTVNGTAYPCQPPSACTSYTGSPCTAGIHTTTTSDPVTYRDSFENTWSGSTGGDSWSGDWQRSTTTTATVGFQSSSPTAQAGSYSIHLSKPSSGSNSWVYRQFNLSSVTGVTLSYYVRKNSNITTSAKTLQVQIASSSSGPWTTIRTLAGNNSTPSNSLWTQYTDALTTYENQTPLFVRFYSTLSSTSDNWYIDDVLISGSINTTTVTPANGYLNGDDLSSSCGSSVPRERQLDVETRNLAVAMKAQGVEIFVVAFGVCSSNSTTYTATQCQSFLITGGLIGNTDDDNTADQRLLKCIASSPPASNDHYYYATSASSLPSIFTSIGAQIAQRLIE